MLRLFYRSTSSDPPDQQLPILGPGEAMTRNVPRVGFVSLGCPKATVDSEQVITQLRAEGYQIVPDYDSADMVIINTCGFIDAAVEESLETIDEALHQNGRVIVTGCLGTRAEMIDSKFPELLAVTGPQAHDEVMRAVHRHLPAPHDPFLDLVPKQRVRLTPRHYAYLKISEGCNHRCSFCIIPSLRGDLVSRPIDEVLDEVQILADAGTREILVISQDTSAYGVDCRYATRFWQGQPLQTRFIDLARALGQFGLWVRLHYVYPYPHVDDVIPLMADGAILPYLDIPMQHASLDREAGRKCSNASVSGAKSALKWSFAARLSSDFRVKPMQISRNCSIFSNSRSSTG
jgi:ribosomal protein S12 methylthiotransferase